MKSHKNKKDVKRIAKDQKRNTNKEKVLKIANFPISKKILEDAVKKAILNPKTGLYDKEIRIIANCIMTVDPDISVSKEMSGKLKKAYQKENPDLCHAIKKLIKRK